ncbi:hypothetical protein ANN_24532 [Periplaneta americana]|uniref:Uncharacterized protein n=1 Tax=Periplaneta americana TaxID=6978 RepID=A0ABQ8S3S1_PERAM|nr:hypothetical protein ANN_24532 [Periplaneta americana]
MTVVGLRCSLEVVPEIMVIILCLPLLGSTLTDNLLIAINSLKLAHLPNTTLIAVHLTSITPFLSAPSANTDPLSGHDSTSYGPSPQNDKPQIPEHHIHPQNPRPNKRHISSHRSASGTPSVDQAESITSENSGTSPSFVESDDSFTHTTSRATQTGRLPRSIPGSGIHNILGSSSEMGSSDVHQRLKRYAPPEDMSQATKRAMLVLTVTEIGVSVDELFSDRRQSSPGNWSRFPESSRMSAHDYCLRGWMKDLLYKIKVNTREELIVRIMDAAALIRNSPDKLRNATRDS